MELQKSAIFTALILCIQIYISAGVTPQRSDPIYDLHGEEDFIDDFYDDRLNAILNSPRESYPDDFRDLYDDDRNHRKDSDAMTLLDNMDKNEVNGDNTGTPQTKEGFFKRNWNKLTGRKNDEKAREKALNKVSKLSLKNVVQLAVNYILSGTENEETEASGDNTDTPKKKDGIIKRAKKLFSRKKKAEKPDKESDETEANVDDTDTPKKKDGILKRMTKGIKKRFSGKKKAEKPGKESDETEANVDDTDTPKKKDGFLKRMKKGIKKRFSGKKKAEKP